MKWHAQRECFIIPGLCTRVIFDFMLIFMYWLISVSSLTWYNPTFRGTALARKTQVMFFGFWWKNGFSAVRPEKSAIWRGWITWCSYLLPWRQQPTKVKVQKWEISSVLVYMWKPSKQRSCELIHCTVLSAVDPAWMVSGLYVSFHLFLSPHVTFFWEESTPSKFLQNCYVWNIV